MEIQYPLVIGELLNCRYRTVKLIGSGTFSQVRLNDFLFKHLYTRKDIFENLHFSIDFYR